MKCKKCGHRSNSLPAMSRHYRKKHPGAMKRRRKAVPKRTRRGHGHPEAAGGALAMHYCPVCGRPH